MSTLSDEIQNDPQGLGYADPRAAGNNQALVRLLNESRTDQVGAAPVPSAELLVWGAMHRLYVGNDTVLELTGEDRLEDQDGNPVEGATMEATLLTQDGTEVPGVTWPVALSDDGGGEYSGVIPSDVEVAKGKRYGLQLVAEAGGAKATWVQTVLAVERSFTE